MATYNVVKKVLKSYNGKLIEGEIVQVLNKFPNTKEVLVMSLKSGVRETIKQTRIRPAILEVTTEQIHKGYKMACSTWQERIKEEFPLLFKDVVDRKFKFGDVITFENYENSYLICSMGTGLAGLINKESGYRVGEPTPIGSPQSISLKELVKMTDEEEDKSTIKSVNGEPFELASTDKKLKKYILVDFIMEMSLAATEEQKEYLRELFPGLLPNPEDFLHFRDGTISISRVSYPLYIGFGKVPGHSSHLRNRCIMFNKEETALELVKDESGDVVGVAFKNLK